MLESNLPAFFYRVVIVIEYYYLLGENSRPAGCHTPPVWNLIEVIR